MGSGESITCTMNLVPVLSATRRAISIEGTALTTVVPWGERRTLTPMIKSRFCFDTLHRLLFPGKTEVLGVRYPQRKHGGNAKRGQVEERIESAYPPSP